MSWASNEAIAILAFLLPGFVSVAVFHMFTSHPKPSEFERIVQSFIFTILVRAVIELLFWICGLLGMESVRESQFEILVSVGVAIILGLIAVYLSNSDLLHSLFRYIGITKETSYPSEWYSAFHHNPDCYVVLHLQGQRRLYGWPEEWPSRPDQGHFRIANGQWLVGDERIPARGVVAIVVPAKEVSMVELFKDELSEESEE